MYQGRIFNRLWWSGTLLHFFWVKSEMMPADALSRLSGTNLTSITQATIDTVSKWGSLMSNICRLTHMGSARVWAHDSCLRRRLASTDLPSIAFFIHARVFTRELRPLGVMPPKGQDEKPQPQQERQRFKVPAIRRLAEVEQEALQTLRLTHETMIRRRNKGIWLRLQINSEAKMTKAKVAQR